MTELLSGVEAPSDAELISRVRGGDVAAYGELFTRHVDAARRLGRQLVRGPDVDDLVSDAFAKTLTVLQHGGGPDVAFRAYLLTSVRRLHVDKIRAAKKVQPADDMTVFDDGVPFLDTAVAGFESGAAAKAFASLPERWQLVLWHLEVEGQKPADIAPLLGMSANSVSALAYRAREGLRQAFLTMHLADSPTEQCRWVNEHLGAYVRKGLSKRDTAKVEEHLDGCRRCTAMYLELNEVNSNLAGIIAPLLLGAAAAGYVSSAGGAGVTGVYAFFGRVLDAVSGNGSAGAGGASTSAGGSAAAAGTGAAATTGGLVTAGGVIAASVAAITAAAFIFGGGAEKELVTEADQPVGIVQTPGPPADSESAESLADSEPGDQERVESLETLGDATTDTDALADAGEAPPESDGFPVESATDGAGVDPDGTADAPVAAPPAADNPAAPGDAPANPPAAGPGSDPAPAPAPGDTTDEPGTTPGDAPGDPGTDQPGTDQPGTDQPGTEQPGNPGTEKPPAQEGPGSSPSPSPSPTPPPVVSTKLAVSAFDVVSGAVSLSFTGATLDSAVRLRISSPAGIDIAAGGDCWVDSADPDYWRCSPTGASSTSLFTRMLAGALASSTSASDYTVHVPLGMPSNQPDRTRVTFEYLVEDEVATPGTYTTPALRIANVGLAAAVAPEALGDHGEYLVTADLTGLPADGVDQLEYHLSGDAMFVATGSDSCSVESGGATLNCASPSAGMKEFVLVGTNPATSTPVSIRVDRPLGFIDPDGGNNTIEVDLPAVSDVPADPGQFGFIGAPSITEIVDTREPQDKRVTVSFSGVLLADEITLELPAQTGFCTDDDCYVGGGADRTKTVTVDAMTAGVFIYTFDMRLPGGSDAVLRATLGRDGSDPDSDLDSAEVTLSWTDEPQSQD